MAILDPPVTMLSVSRRHQYIFFDDFTSSVCMKIVVPFSLILDMFTKEEEYALD